MTKKYIYSNKEQLKRRETTEGGISGLSSIHAKFLC